MNDLLDRATRASRQTPTPPTDTDQTRARILATVHRGAVRPPRRLAHTWAIPLVAALLATGAAAAVGTGVISLPGRTPPAVSLAAPPAVSLAAPPAPARPGQPSHAPALAASPSAPASAPEPTPETPEPPALAPTAPTAAVAPVAPPASGATASRPTAVAVVSAAVPDEPAEALYREAHGLHFRGGDAGAAVSAWERYLAAAPRGRFAPEARYNRALALLRAGRRADGLAALAPFASGPTGGYRQAEARRLLEAAGQPAAGAP